MNILVTGFDPFGGESINPAQQAVLSLPEVIGEKRLHKLVVPTVFGKAAEKTIEEMERLRPDAVICVGQAGGRAAVTPERVAINLLDASIPDNAGDALLLHPCALYPGADGG